MKKFFITVSIALLFINSPMVNANSFKQVISKPVSELVIDQIILHSNDRVTSYLAPAISNLTFSIAGYSSLAFDQSLSGSSNYLLPLTLDPAKIMDNSALLNLGFGGFKTVKAPDGFESWKDYLFKNHGYLSGHDLATYLLRWFDPLKEIETQSAHRITKDVLEVYQMQILMTLFSLNKSAEAYSLVALRNSEPETYFNLLCIYMMLIKDLLNFSILNGEQFMSKSSQEELTASLQKSVSAGLTFHDSEYREISRELRDFAFTLGMKFVEGWRMIGSTKQRSFYSDVAQISLNAYFEILYKIGIIDVAVYLEITQDFGHSWRNWVKNPAVNMAGLIASRPQLNMLADLESLYESDLPGIINENHKHYGRTIEVVLTDGRILRGEFLGDDSEHIAMQIYKKDYSSSKKDKRGFEICLVKNDIKKRAWKFAGHDISPGRNIKFQILNTDRLTDIREGIFLKEDRHFVHIRVYDRFRGPSTEKKFKKSEIRFVCESPNLF